MDYVSFLLNQSNDPIEQLRLLRKNGDKLEVKIFINYLILQEANYRPYSNYLINKYLLGLDVYEEELTNLNDTIPFGVYLDDLINYLNSYLDKQKAQIRKSYQAEIRKGHVKVGDFGLVLEESETPLIGQVKSINRRQGTACVLVTYGNVLIEREGCVVRKLNLSKEFRQAFNKLVIYEGDDINGKR